MGDGGASVMVPPLPPAAPELPVEEQSHSAGALPTLITPPAPTLTVPVLSTWKLASWLWAATGANAASRERMVGLMIGARERKKSGYQKRSLPGHGGHMREGGFAMTIRSATGRCLERVVDGRPVALATAGCAFEVTISNDK